MIPYGVGPIVSLSQLDGEYCQGHWLEAYDVALDYHRETAAAGAFDLFRAGDPGETH